MTCQNRWYVTKLSDFGLITEIDSLITKVNQFWKARIRTDLQRENYKGGVRVKMVLGLVTQD